MVMTSNGTTVAAASATSAKAALISSVVEKACAMRARAAARGGCAGPFAASDSAVPRPVMSILLHLYDERTVLRTTSATKESCGRPGSLPQGADDRLGRLAARELLLAGDQIAVAHRVAPPQSRLDVVRS